MLINFKFLSRKNKVNSSAYNGGKNSPRQSKLSLGSKHFLFLLFLTFISIGETFAKSLDLANTFPNKLENINSTRAKNDINQILINSTAVVGNVLINDIDEEGDNQSLVSATYLNASGTSTSLLFLTATDIYDEAGNLAGSIFLKQSGAYSFNPAQDYSGTIMVNYVVTDDNVDPATDMATLSIEVLPYPSVVGNDYVTIAIDDTNTVEQGETVTSFVTVNDIDPDGNSNTAITATASNGWGSLVTLGSTPEDIYNTDTELAGQASIDGNGNIQFTADASFEGKVAIDYAISMTSTAVLTITVEASDATDNDTYANDDANMGLQEATLTGNILNNDYDAEGNSQTISSAKSNSGIDMNLGSMTEIETVGQLLVNTNGDYTFIPFSTFSGTERIEYAVCDNNGTQACEKASLYLTILPTNSTMAEDDIHQMAINTVAKGFLLTNDRDEQGDELAVQSASYLNASGQSQVLTLDVETQIFDENAALAGTFELASNGNYTFDPVAEYVGKVPVHYVINDNNGNEATDAAILRIYVLSNPLDPGFNNNVIAQDDTNTVESGGTVQAYLLWNDRDIDGDVITAVSAKVSNGAGGTVEILGSNQIFYDVNNTIAGVGNLGAGGKVTFKASPAFVGEVIVNYTISDNKGSLDYATLTITVEPYKSEDNDTYANDDANVGLQDVTLTGNVQGNDYDPEGVDQDIASIDTDGDGIPETQPLVGVIIPISVEGVFAGTFTMDSKVGAYVWNPEPHFLGTVIMPYIATDGSVYNTATLYLTNLPLNSTDAKDDINNTPFNTVVRGDVSTNDIDEEGNERGFFLKNANGGMNNADGTINLLTNGSYIFTPATGFVGSTKFEYEVCDNGYPIRCKISTVHLEVLPEIGVQTQPIVANVDANTAESKQLVTGNVLPNDVDLEGRDMKVTTLFNGQNIPGINEIGEVVSAAGKLTLNDNGVYSFLSLGDFIGRVEQSYTICLVGETTICDDALLIIDVKRDEGNSTYANDDAAITDMGIATVGKLLTNDKDMESDVQTVTTFHYDSNGDGKAETEGTLGSNTAVGGYDMAGAFVSNSGIFNVDTNGNYIFTPANGFTGNVVLPYTICDGVIIANNETGVACSVASLVITVLEVNRDWSDGPDVYDAAWHRAMEDADTDDVLDGENNVWLGSKTNFETIDLSSSDASTDSFDDALSFGSAAGEFPEIMLPSADYDIDVKLNSLTSALVYYGMWIDWDNDGVYDDFYNGSSNITGETTINVAVTAPTYIGAIVNVRLRADDNEFLEADYAGGRTNGEVEDYQNVVALPVELLYFQGSNDDCTNELGWATATEKNNSHFIVEHSLDGENFEELDRVEGNGNSADLVEYEYIHENITAEENYYRLKQVDYDGAFEYSDIIIVQSSCDELGSEKVSIYPNPSKGIVTTEISNESGVEKEIEIRVTDVMGRTLISRNVTIQSGMNYEEIDLTKYTKGTYMISIIRNGNEVETYPVSLLTN